MRLVSKAATPLAAESFSPLMVAFGPYEDNPVLGVAVSGGRDSLALAFLAHDWARTLGGRVIGLIVDHGLRTEAAQEAASTLRLLRDHCVDAEILRWAGPKPGRGIQEAARSARYRLLFEACRRHRILHLLVAHHADDQAETIAMRAEHGSGPDGLAGMAAMVEHAQARLLRPLLGVPRARLAATLQARGVPWIDDPSNLDLRFERVRLRRRGAPAPSPRPDAANARAARESELARHGVEVLDFDGGDVAIDSTSFARLDPASAARLLSRVVQSLGGRDHPPRRDRLARATARLLKCGPRGKSGRGQDFTLGSCRLMLRASRTGSGRPRWIFRPENGKNYRRKGGQSLIPATFFACGRARAPHLD